MGKTKSVEQTIKDIVIGILHCEKNALTLATAWKDLEADSLDLVQMLVALEETYKIEISDEDAEHLSTFGDLVKYIEKRVAGNTN